MHFGYDFINGEFVVNQKQSKVVEFIYEKFIEYSTNPPRDLVEAVMEQATARGESLTYDEAKTKVPMIKIEERIWDELNAIPEYARTIAEYNKTCAEQIKQISNLLNIPQNVTITTAQSAPIVSEETWKTAQEAMKNRPAKRVATYVRVSTHSNSTEALEQQKQMMADYCKKHGYELRDTVCAIGDKHLGCEMLLELIDKAEAEGIDTIVIASVDRVAANKEEIAAIKEHLAGKNVHIETKDGTHVLFDYADIDDGDDDISFGLTIMG